MAYDIGPKIGIEGESEFRNAIKQINDNMKTLGTEMKVVASQFDKNDTSTEALTAKNQVLTKEIDQQTLKLQKLKDGLESAATKYGENDQVTQGWQRAVNNATAELNGLERKLKDNNETMEKGEDVTSDMSKVIKDLGDDADESGKQVFNMGDLIKANLIADTIVGGVKKLADSFKSLASDALDSADSIQQLADKSGMSAETIQEWQYVGDTVGTSIEDITGAQVKLTKSMVNAKDGSDKYVDAFKQLGIAVTDGNGKLRDSNTVMTEAFAALGNIKDETERNALGMQIFGKSFTNLNPLVKAGSDEIKNLTNQARDNGAVMSNETVAGLDDFGDSMGQLSQTFQTMAGTILNKLTPSIQPLIEKIKNMDVTPIVNMLQFILDNSSTVITGIAGIGAGLLTWKVAGMINSVVTAIQGLTFAQQGATVAQEGLNVAMKSNPIGIIVTLISVVVTALVTFIATNEDARNKIVQAWNTLKDTVGNAVDTVAGFFTKVLPNAIKDLVTKVKALPGNIKNQLDKVISNVKSWANDFKTKAVDGASKMASGVVNGITSLPGKIKAKLDEIISKVISWSSELKSKASSAAKNMSSAVVSGVTSLPSKIGDIGSKTIKALWNGINNFTDWIGIKVNGLASGIVRGISNGFSGIANVGKNLVQGLWNGINNMTGWVTDKIKGFSDSVLDGIKSFFGIHSPSTVFRDEVGKYLAQGIGIGFTSEMSNVTKDINNSIPTDFDINGSYNVTGNNSLQSKAANSGLQVIFQISEFNNYTSDDLETLSNELAFMTKRKLEGSGGVAYGTI